MNPLQSLGSPQRLDGRANGAAHSAPLRIRSSAPGRICLFGEHQDYLALPVIAMAVDLRVEIEARRRDDEWLHVELPDTGQQFDMLLNLPYTYRHGRDYLPAAANILRRRGLRWSHGYDVTVRGGVPLNSGASSSSALQVAWSAFLLAAAGDARAHDAAFVARLAYEGEVPEFGSPGGMMDHYTSALGGIVFLDCQDPIHWHRYDVELGPFVLIDSGTPKDTNGVLGRVRGGIEAGVRSLAEARGNETASLATLRTEDLIGLRDHERQVLEATLANYAITIEADKLLEEAGPGLDSAIGILLSRHHGVLRDGLGISTSLIDSLLGRAQMAGALGGKINGSGGGGSCFALAPTRAEQVSQLLAAEGFRVFTVRSGPGLQVEVE